MGGGQGTGGGQRTGGERSKGGREREVRFPEARPSVLGIVEVLENVPVLLVVYPDAEIHRLILLQFIILDIPGCRMVPVPFLQSATVVSLHLLVYPVDRGYSY